MKEVVGSIGQKISEKQLDSNYPKEWIFIANLPAVNPAVNILANLFNQTEKFPAILPSRLILINLMIFIASWIQIPVFAQTTGVQPQYYSPQPTTNSYMKSSVFRQEIARFQINVVREDREPLPITQVPRVRKGDVLKVKLLDEAVGGLKLDQTNWDWTFLVAYINPLRRMKDSVDGNGSKNNKGTKEANNPVSEEIRFRERGWYREYSFTVPYDSQPVFFLYPKPKYRKQLLKVVSSKYEDLRKLGEKTIELADAYSKINSFLNELQFVLNRNAQLYGFTYIPGSPNSTNNGSSNPTNPYNSSNPTYNPYNPYSPYPSVTTPGTNQPPQVPVFGLNTMQMLNHVVEGLARGFNITLPNCWGTNTYNNYGNNSSYGSSTYSSGYSGSSNYGGSSGYGGSSYGNNNQIMDFVNRAQCVAKNVNLQDFDISVTKMWQQGGVFLAAELQKKYPQLAYWINIAATAIDFIVKVFQKSPLRIVPTVIQSADGNTGIGAYGNTGGGYGNNYSSTPNPSSPNAINPNQGKVSLFADTQPTDGAFVTAYPIVVHKWQATPDPEVLSLYPPVLAEPCLHAGVNLLKSTELNDKWGEDQYSRDFKLVLSSANGFRKEFPLRKNIGLGGWELNLTPEDLNQIPKLNMTLEAELLGMRGFNEIRSPKFNLPISMGGSWELTPESQKEFTVGGRKTVTIKNMLGNCRCLQRVIYKPSIGGQFIFEAGKPDNPNSLQFSVDNKQVSFEIDTTGFQPGAGTLEIKTFGGETQQVQMNQYNQPGANQTGAGNNLTLKLYPASPIITEVQARRGDREILLTGERLEQISSVIINGKRAVVKGNATRGSGDAGTGGQNGYPNQPQIPSQSGSMSNQVVTASPLLPVSVSQYRNISQNQRIVVFEDAATRINSEHLTIELSLEDNRIYQYPKRFSVGISRPLIKANEQNEIDGSFLRDEGGRMRDESSINPPNLNSKDNSKVKVNLQKNPNSPLLEQLLNYPVVLNDKNKLTIAVQNILTDYSFRLENLSIETNIEKATLNPGELPQVNFEVLDTNSLRINFNLSLSTIKALSGRRLQFRIIDRERGNSDWYTIKQTFVRIPIIESVKCSSQSSGSLQNSASSQSSQSSPNQPNSVNSVNSVNLMPCELKGEGLDYISQISVDGGRNWNPQNGTQLQVELTEDGKNKIMVPMLINQKFLQIKLRDYPNTEGLTITNFVYANTVKGVKKTNPSSKQNSPQSINQGQRGNQNLNPINQSAKSTVKGGQKRLIR